MKNSKFIFWQGFLGAAAGSCIWGILAAISGDNSYALRAYAPNAAMTSYSALFSPFFHLLSHLTWLLMPLALVCSFIAVVLLVRQLVPDQPSILDQILPSVAIVALTYLCSTNNLLDFKTIDWANFVCVVGASAIGWLVIYRHYWIGNRSIVKTRQFIFTEILALGAINGVFLVFLFSLTAHIYSFFFSVSWTVWEDGLSAKRFSVLGASCLGPFIISAIGFGFAPVLAANEISLRERLNRASTPLILLLIVSGLFGAIYYKAIHEYDWDKTFEQATGIPDTQIPTSKTLVNLTFDKTPKVELQDWPMMTIPNALFLEKTKVATTFANLEALQKFLLSPSHQHSRYWRIALDDIPELEGALWDPRGLTQFYADASTSPCAFRLTNFMFNVRALLWISKNSPIDEFGRRKLEFMSDAGLFNIKAYTLRRLALAWRRYDDMSKAQYWNEKFLASDAERKEKNKIDLNTVGLLTKGVITGKINLKGISTEEPLKVGLFREDSTTKSYGAPGRSDSFFSPASVFYRIVDSRTIQKGGTFRFEDLSDGAYSLVVMLPSSALPADTKNLKVKRHPGILKLSKKKPTVNTGTITLVLPKK